MPLARSPYRRTIQNQGSADSSANHARRRSAIPPSQTCDDEEQRNACLHGQHDSRDDL